ncbi:MAG TPA: disulfide bond formation protein B [Pirellulales bacterium]|nr:disulfide bond formation protein B [Pirellulales bacterium]
MTQPPLTPNVLAGRQGAMVLNGAALSLAVIAASGSVYLSLGLGLKACPLCFYQRSFALAAVLVLAMQLSLEGLRSAHACLVSLPLAASGLGVAAFHVYLVQIGKLECPPALLGWGDGPLQSLAVFGALTLVCLAGACSARRTDGGGSLPAIVAALLLGAAAAWASIASAPSLPPAPTQPYDAVKQPFDMCRPPFRGA